MCLHASDLAIIRCSKPCFMVFMDTNRDHNHKVTKKVFTEVRTVNHRALFPQSLLCTLNNTSVYIRVGQLVCCRF